MPRLVEQALRSPLCRRSCVALVGIAAAAFALQQWSDVASELVTYMGQRPALCVDGRLLNESMEEAAFQVDDIVHDPDAGPGALTCRFQVFVYPCARVLDACRRAAAWPCGDAQWRCQGGACTGYQKAAMACAAGLDGAPYACHFAPGNVAAGVAAPGPFEPPLLSGALAAVVSALLLVCGRDAAASAFGDARQDDASGLALHVLLLLGLFAAAAAWLQLAVGTAALRGAPPSEPALEGRVWGRALHEAPPWQAAVETFPWRDMILIAAALLVAYVTAVLFSALRRGGPDERPGTAGLGPGLGPGGGARALAPRGALAGPAE